MITLYYHGGSANHGCEAIVRSTYKILGEPLTLFSSSIAEEQKYGIDQIVDVAEDVYKPLNKTSMSYIKCALYSKLYKSDYQFIKYGHKTFLNSISKGDICLSIGGDNYCYAGTDKLSFYNRMIHEKGAKTVLWGCSIDPSVLSKSVIWGTRRVSRPTNTTSRPSAKLSNVPVCPTFFVPRAFFTTLRAVKLVSPGCFAYKTMPAAVLFLFIAIRILNFSIVRLF